MLNNDSKILIISFSNNGSNLNLKLKELLKDYDVDNYSYYKYAHDELKSFDNTKALVKESFNSYDFIIFIGACGLAVREISPYVKSKLTDPGVIVIDELGNFVIPILSGHVGGANDFARSISNLTNSTLVITTATDINNKFAVDEWAKKNDLYLDNYKIAKDISARILNQDIPFKSDFKIEGNLPNGLAEASNNKDMGIYLTYLNEPFFKETLFLIPKVLNVGIGCKKGTNSKVILEAIKETFKENKLQLKAIRTISSIDVKKDEQGIIDASKELGVDFITYSKEELNSIDGDFSYSEFVFKTVGVDCVCERSASIQSNKLLVKKTVKNSVTISIGIIDYIIKF